MLNLFLCAALVNLFGESFDVPGAVYGGGAPISLEGMDCPLFLNKRETGNFSAIVSNLTNSEHRADVRFSTSDAVQSSIPSHQMVSLSPSSTTRAIWRVAFDEPGSRTVYIKLTNDGSASYSYGRAAFDYCSVAVIDVLGLQAEIVVGLGAAALALAVAILVYALRQS
jgi:hypothetical protein